MAHMALPPGSNGERRFQRRSGKVWEEGQVHVRARDLWNMVLRGQGVTRLSPVPQVLSAACLGRVHHLRMGLLISVVEKGFPGGARGKESSSQRLRHGFDPWVRKIPWRRRWQPTPVSLPGDPVDGGASWATVRGDKRGEQGSSALPVFCQSSRCAWESLISGSLSFRSVQLCGTDGASPRT